MAKVIRIGNGQGFWGDRIEAPAELARQQGDLDYLTLDYLAEVSMSILARQWRRDPAAGYPRDFIDSLRLLGPVLAERRRSHPLRVVTNAGGLNVRGCGEMAREVLLESGCRGMRVGLVTGDDVLGRVREAVGTERAAVLANLETGEAIDAVAGDLVTANAYLGAGPIMAALEAGAEVVIAGRVADPSMTVGPCAHEFGWGADQLDELAGATLAGHLIECGVQVTGGISTDWLSVPEVERIGYPVAEVDEAGGCVITKPAGTGGRVDERTVKEQMVYEVGDPGRYLSPDVTVSLLDVSVADEGGDRVRVSGARGAEPPTAYKVSATYRVGWRASGAVTIAGPDAAEKARRCAAMVRRWVTEAAGEPRHWSAQVIGAGGVMPSAADRSATEVVLRVGAADERREVAEALARNLMPLVTAGPQGVCGYGEGRPRVHEVFGYWPCRIERERVEPRVEVIEV